MATIWPHHMGECHINSSRTKHTQFLTGNVSRDVVYLLRCLCYLVSAGCLTACPSLSPEPCSLLPSLPLSLSLSTPAAPWHGDMAAREREGRLSFRNINYSLETHTHSHILCLCWPSLCIGSPHSILFGLSANNCWHTVICAHTVFLSHHL